MATYQKKDWTNELGQPTHKLNYTGELVMIFEIDKETGLLHCLTGNEASVFVEANELEEIK